MRSNNGIRVRTRTDIPRVLRRVRNANITSLKHAGGVIRLTARRSIRRKPYRFKTLPSGAKVLYTQHAPAGRPPYSHTESHEFWGLRESIMFHVTPSRDNVIIGPRYSGAERIGHLHEFGGTRKNKRSRLVLAMLRKRERWSLDRYERERKRRVAMRYPKRPFMGPALMKIKDRLPKHWADSF
jgi:hypothetical protein